MYYIMGGQKCVIIVAALHNCAEVRAAIELSFGVESGVTPVIHVLDGVHVPQGKGVDFGVICPRWPNGFNCIFCNRNVFDSCVKI